MKAYVYRAAFLCEDCASREKDKLINAWAQGNSFPSEVEQQDSDVFPQGPYSNGGGEADTPQHCDHCGVFLENPLTTEGADYVRETAEEYSAGEHVDESWEDLAQKADSDNPVLAQWIRFYFAPGQ